MMALLAVPYCASLVYRVVTYDTLLSTIRECLYKVHTLFCEISELINEILWIVLYRSLVLCSLSLPLFLFVYIGYLFIFSNKLSIIIVSKIISS